MSLTSITLEWGDGDQVFDLPIAQVEELEAKTGLGILRIARRIWESEAKTTEVREVLRLGLIGGGKDPIQALALMRFYFDPAPASHYAVAYKVLKAWADANPPSKKKPETQSQTTAGTAGSTSTPSMETAPQSDSAPIKSAA